MTPTQFAIAETLSKLNGITIIGGGDSVAAVEAAGAWCQCSLQSWEPCV